MPWYAQWFVINVAFLAAIVLLARFIGRANARKAQQLAEQLKPEAARRGWQVRSDLHPNNMRVIRWSGREFDIAWIGEDVYRRRGHGTNRSVLEVTRWQTVDRRGPTGTVLLMGMPPGTKLPKAQAVEGFFQSLAVKAAFLALDKALDMYFGVEIGKEIDANTLKRVEEVEPLLNGYAVFAENTHEAANLIRGGVDKAIAETVETAASLGGSRRPWILLWKRGVVVARVGPTRSAAELEPFVKAGAAITKASSRF